MSDDLFPEAQRKSYLELLEALITPYVDAADLKSEQDWEAVEADLGVSLPESYKKVCRFLPGGCLGEGLAWVSPFSEGYYTGLSRAKYETQYGNWSAFGDVPLYPKIPGYLIFANSSMRISFVYEVTLDSDGSATCQPKVFLLDGDILEETGLEVDELLYRCITWNPPLEDSVAEWIHKPEFEDANGWPLFRYPNLIAEKLLNPR